MMPASTDRLCLQNVNERMTDVERILSDEKVKNVELQMIGQENDLENDTLLDIQSNYKVIYKVLKIKREIQMIN